MSKLTKPAIALSALLATSFAHAGGGNGVDYGPREHDPHYGRHTDTVDQEAWRVHNVAATRIGDETGVVSSNVDTSSSTAIVDVSKTGRNLEVDQQIKMGHSKAGLDLNASWVINSGLNTQAIGGSIATNRVPHVDTFQFIAGNPVSAAANISAPFIYRADIDTTAVGLTATVQNASRGVHIVQKTEGLPVLSITNIEADTLKRSDVTTTAVGVQAVIDGRKPGGHGGHHGGPGHDY